MERREPVRLDKGGWSERVVFDVATTDNINAHKSASGIVNNLSSEPILSEPIEFEVRDVTDGLIVMCTFGKEITVNWVRVAEGRWLNADDVAPRHIVSMSFVQSHTY